MQARGVVGVFVRASAGWRSAVAVGADPHVQEGGEMSSMKEIYLITLKSSMTRTGLLSDMLEVMAAFKVKMLDVAQSEIHDVLSIGMLIEVCFRACIRVAVSVSVCVYFHVYMYVYVCVCVCTCCTRNRLCECPCISNNLYASTSRTCVRTHACAWDTFERARTHARK